MPRTAAQYRQLLQNLLPSGAAWPRRDGSVQTAVLAALSQEFARVDARAAQARIEIDYDTTDECLSDWERDFGLPDDCTDPTIPLTIAQRRGQVKARDVSTGGDGDRYWVDLLAAAGFTATVSRPSAYQFHIHVTGFAISVFRCDTGRAGDRLREFGAEKYIECRVFDLKHAHVRVTFYYDGVIGTTG